jgi:hypothetical protein
MSVRIKLTRTQVDLLRQQGVQVELNGEHYISLPYWFREIPGEKRMFEQLDTLSTHNVAYPRPEIPESMKEFVSVEDDGIDVNITALERLGVKYVGEKHTLKSQDLHKDIVVLMSTEYAETVKHFLFNTIGGKSTPGEVDTNTDATARLLLAKDDFIPLLNGKSFLSLPTSEFEGISVGDFIVVEEREGFAVPTGRTLKVEVAHIVFVQDYLMASVRQCSATKSNI